MDREKPEQGEPQLRDEDSMYYLVTFLWGMMAWIISGNAVYGIFGALLGWMVDEWRATRRRAHKGDVDSTGDDA